MLSTTIILLSISSAAEALNICAQANTHAVPLSTSANMSPNLSRRSALFVAAALPMLLQSPEPASAATMLSNEDKALIQVKKLAVKARRLREAVRSDGAASAARVQKERESVLLPLQAEMARGAPILMYLTQAEFDDAQIQPQLLRNHLGELDQALSAADGFAVYTSKSTRKEYPGGRVERELEEVLETCDDFLALSKKYFVGKAEAGPLVAAKK